MISYARALTPMLLSILVGSLIFVFARSERGDVGETPNAVKTKFGAPALPGGKQGRGFPPGFVAEQLNLSEEQKEQIKQLHEKSREDSVGYFEKVKIADAELKQLLDSGNFDEAQARKIVGEKTQAIAELEIIRLRTGTWIRNILDDEQKLKLSGIESHRPEPPPGGGKLGMPPPLPPPGAGSEF